MLTRFLHSQGKLPLTGITITQVEDTDEIRNAFEITGKESESFIRYEIILITTQIRYKFYLTCDQ